MKVFFLVLSMALCQMLAAQVAVPAFPTVNDLQRWDTCSGIQIIHVFGDSIVSSWKNGVLDGPYAAYYSNGHVKAKGAYSHNFRKGKWTLYSNDSKGKVVLDFTDYGNVILRRARISGVGGVRFGRGKIVNNVPDANAFSKDTIYNHVQGIVKFRHGLKNGVAIEKFSDGTIRSEAGFKDGLYDGLRKIFYYNGKVQFQCEYKNGVPFGERKEYTPDGALYTSRVMDLSGGSQSSFHLDRFDVFSSSRSFIYTDTIFDATALFFKPDSAAPLFKVLNASFLEGKLSAYKDYELREVYFPMHDKPDLSGLRTDVGNDKNLRGFMIKTEEIFNAQTWLMYRLPLAIQPVSSYLSKDTLAFAGGPWLYFPQLRNEIPASNYHFSFFKSFSYPFISAMQMGSKAFQTDYSTTIGIAKEQINSVENEHNLWLMFYGLDKDGQL